MSSLPFSPAVPAGAAAHHAERARPSPRRLSAASLLAISWLAPALLVLIWELAARAGQVSPQVLPAPSKIAATAWSLIQQGRLISDLFTSLLHILGVVSGDD